jgi:Type IIA topoisomerase (DNA gyrase/topo II, topoisomerase IV), A subunit
MEELCSIVKGPDFPTGGLIVGRSGIMEAYTTGRGGFTLRSRIDFEEKRNRLIVREIPYTVNKANLVKNIAELSKNRVIDGISEIRDESNRQEGVRIVIELKRGTNHEVVLNRLFAHTQLQTRINMISIAIYKNQPKIFSLKEMLQTFLDHRVEIITRRTVFDLTKTKERVEILEGLIRAIQNIEMVIELIRKSKNVKEAKEHMISKFSLSERQSKAILEMQLQRLTALEQDSLEKEREKCYDNIKRYESILGNESELMTVIKNELLEMRKKYGDERKSQIIEEEEVMVDEESFYEDKKEIVMFSDDGYVKRSDYESYKLQNRGGVGVIGIKTKEEDLVRMVVSARTRDYLLLFTNYGIVHWLKVYKVPEMKKHSRGLPIVNLLKMRENERVLAILSTRDFTNELVLVTRKGITKKTSFKEFSVPRSHGKIAIKLREGDELAGAVSCSASENILIGSKNGMVVNFDEKNLREIGRCTQGVIGMRLKKDDSVVSILNLKKGYFIVAITEKGYGKRTPYNGNYRKTSRGCKGVKGISISEKNGKLLTLLKAREKDEILIASERGNVIKIKVKNISIQGRYARGVRLMRLKGTDRVKSATIVA